MESIGGNVDLCMDVSDTGAVYVNDITITYHCYQRCPRLHHCQACACRSLDRLEAASRDAEAGTGCD